MWREKKEGVGKKAGEQGLFESAPQKWKKRPTKKTKLKSEEKKLWTRDIR